MSFSPPLDFDGQSSHIGLVEPNRYVRQGTPWKLAALVVRHLGGFLLPDEPNRAKRLLRRNHKLGVYMPRYSVRLSHIRQLKHFARSLSPDDTIELSDHHENIIHAICSDFFGRWHGKQRKLESFFANIMKGAEQLISSDFDDEDDGNPFHIGTCHYNGNYMIRKLGVLLGDGNVVSQSTFRNHGYVCPLCSSKLLVQNSHRVQDMRICSQCVRSRVGRCACNNNLPVILSRSDCGTERCSRHDSENRVVSGRHGGYYAVRPLFVDQPIKDTSHKKVMSDRQYLLPYSQNVLDVLRKYAFVASNKERNLPGPFLWLGVELEFVVNDSTRLELVRKEIFESLEHFAIIKSDASLPGTGAEVVTVPATLEYHRERWQKFFDGPAKKVHSWTNDACGMHVHMSRDYLGPVGLGKLLRFINLAENSRFIEIVAGRGSNNYSNLNPSKKITDAFGVGFDSRIAARISNEERTANLFNHRDALCVSGRNGGLSAELRIFKGNVSKNGFFKNLDFTVAAADFCKQTSLRHLRWENFIEWMELPTNRGSFPYLAEFLADSALMKRLHKKKDVPIFSA